MKDSWNEESRGGRERTTALYFHDGPAESILVYVTIWSHRRGMTLRLTTTLIFVRENRTPRSKVLGTLT